MSLIDSSSSTIQAVLTRRGRELLATDSSQFNITKFAFGDDEINYSFYDGTSPDADNSVITSTPVTEPMSENISTLRWGIATYAFGKSSVADIELPKMPDGVTNRKLGFIVGTQNLLTIRTLRGYDGVYYVNSTSPATIAPIRDQFSSIPDTTKFDSLQNQSKCELWFNVNGLPGQSCNLIIKGGNTNVTKTVKAQVYATKEDATRDAFNP